MYLSYYACNNLAKRTNSMLLIVHSLDLDASDTGIFGRRGLHDTETAHAHGLEKF